MGSRRRDISWLATRLLLFFVASAALVFGLRWAEQALWPKSTWPLHAGMALSASALVTAGAYLVLRAHTGARDRREQQLRQYGVQLEDEVSQRTDETHKFHERLQHEVAARKSAEEALRESEERYRNLVERGVLGLYRTTPDGRILMANPALARMLGFESVEELTKRNLEQEGFAPAGSRAEFRECIERDGEVIGLESVWLRRDGTTVTVRENARAVRDDSGAVRYYEGTVEDITQRKQAEEQLRKAEREQRLILGAVTEHVVAYDCEQRIVRANRAAAESLGMAPEEMIGRHCYDLWHRRQDPCEGCPVIKACETGTPAEGEITTDDGRIWSVRGYPLFDADGRTIGAVEVTREVTEQRQAEESQRAWEAKAQQIQKLESLGLMAGGIAHDFNNLLAVILGNASLALMDLPDDHVPVRYSMEQVEKAARRAADLTNQLLAYAGRGTVMTVQVDVSALVDEMADFLKVSVGGRAELVYELTPALPRVEADETQMRQVIMNLVSNAAEARYDGGRVITVRTGQTDADAEDLENAHAADDAQPGSYVFVEVADTGAGVDGGACDRIFDPFFSTKEAGRGLGLSVVHGIVRAHHGAIMVTSGQGAGTTFRVLLPPAEREAEPIVEPQEPRAEKVSVGTVLVVDDEEGVRQMVRMALERFGFTVLQAASGREGVEVFRDRAEDIDVVLLDVTMPDLHGEDVFDAIRGVKAGVRVILSSGYDRTETTSRLAGTPHAGFIKKPYLPMALVGKVREIMNT